MNSQNAVISGIDFSSFDYQNLKGKEFLRFQTYLNELSPEYDPDPRSNKGVKTLFTDTPLDWDMFEAAPVIDRGKLVGVSLKSNEPIRTTRMSINLARQFNAQIMSPQAVGGTGKYYLPKK